MICFSKSNTTISKIFTTKDTSDTKDFLKNRNDRFSFVYFVPFVFKFFALEKGTHNELDH